MHRPMSSRERRRTILSNLKDGNFTTNEIIDRFYNENCETFMTLTRRKQKDFLTTTNDPNVYTHINKEPSYLKKAGYVTEHGTKVGKKGLEETILKITPAGRRALRTETY